MCRTTNFTTFPNKQNERIINALSVFCTNKDKGCQWRGEVNDITKHLDDCRFEDVSCLNDCGLSVQRQNLTSHVENDCPRRSVNCQYCHTTGEYQFIKGEHKKECPKFPLRCPNECSMTIARENMDEHKMVCPRQLIQCPNLCGQSYQRQHQFIHLHECPCRKVRCKYCKISVEQQAIKLHFKQCPKYPLPCPNKCSENSIPREDIDKHRQECPLETVSCSNGCGKDMQQQHLIDHVENHCLHRKITCQFCNDTGEYRFIEHRHKEQCPKLPVLCPNECNATILRKNMTAHRKVCPLEIIPCEFHGDGCQARMIRKDCRRHDQEKVVQHLLFTKSELISTKSKLMNTEKQLAAIEKKLASNIDAALAKMEAKLQQRINELDAVAHKNNWFRKLNSRAAASLSGKGSLPVTIKLTGYSQKRRNCKMWTSKYFYTPDRKYQAQLTVRFYSSSHYPYNDSTHLSVEIHFESYEYSSGRYYSSDDETESRKFKVQILNQIEDNKHLSETQKVSFRTNVSYWVSNEYTSTETIDKSTAKCQYLKHDTIFFAVYQLQASQIHNANPDPDDYNPAYDDDDYDYDYFVY